MGLGQQAGRHGFFHTSPPCLSHQLAVACLDVSQAPAPPPPPAHRLAVGDPGAVPDGGVQVPLARALHRHRATGEPGRCVLLDTCIGATIQTYSFIYSSNSRYPETPPPPPSQALLLTSAAVAGGAGGAGRRGDVRGVDVPAQPLGLQRVPGQPAAHGRAVPRRRRTRHRPARRRQVRTPGRHVARRLSTASSHIRRAATQRARHPRPPPLSLPPSLPACPDRWPCGHSVACAMCLPATW